MSNTAPWMRPGSRPGPSPRGPPPNSQPMVGVMHGQGPPGTQYNAGGQGPNDWGPASQQGYANAGSNVMNGPGPQNQGAPPGGSLPPWASKASSPNAMRGPPGGQMMQQHQAPPMQHLQQPMQQHPMHPIQQQQQPQPQQQQQPPQQPPQQQMRGPPQHAQGPMPGQTMQGGYSGALLPSPNAPSNPPSMQSSSLLSAMNMGQHTGPQGGHPGGPFNMPPTHQQPPYQPPPMPGPGRAYPPLHQQGPPNMSFPPQMMPNMQQPPFHPGMSQPGPPQHPQSQQFMPPPQGPLPAPDVHFEGDPGEVKEFWSEHTAPDGRPYFYNRFSKKSTYEKPDCLKSPAEKSIPPCKWKEYEANGRKYFSDGAVSVWEEPDELKLYKRRLAALIRGEDPLKVPLNSEDVDPTKDTTQAPSIESANNNPDSNEPPPFHVDKQEQDQAQGSVDLVDLKVANRPEEKKLEGNEQAEVPVKKQEGEEKEMESQHEGRIETDIDVEKATSLPLYDEQSKPAQLSPSKSLDTAEDSDQPEPPGSSSPKESPAQTIAVTPSSAAVPSVKQEEDSMVRAIELTLAEKVKPEPEKNQVEHPQEPIAKVKMEEKKVAPSPKRALEDVKSQQDSETNEEEEVVYATKDEAVLAFKEMLLEQAVFSTTKWSDAVKLCEGDKRWQALKTLGERRQALAEYQTKRLKEEKEEKRMKARKARDGFLKMLAENTEIDSRTRWREAEQILGPDSRFTAVEEERDREELFNDFITELGKKEKEEKKIARKEAKKKFEAFIRSGKIDIDYKTRYKDLAEKFEKVAKAEGFSILDKEDMREQLEELTRELQKKQDRKEEKEREEKKKREKEAREAFKAILKSQAKKGEITYDSKWKSIKDSYVDDEPYKVLKDTKTIGASPKEVFDECIDELVKKYREDRRSIDDVIRASGLKIQYDSEFDPYTEDLKDWEDQNEKKEEKRVFSQILKKRPWHVQAIFEEFLKKAISEKEEEDRRRAKRIRMYQDLLEDYYYRSDHVGTKWSSATRDLERHSAFKDLDEDTRHQLFEEYMTALEEKMPKKKKKKDKEGREKDNKEKDSKKKDKDSKKKKKKKESKKSPSISPSVSRSPSVESEVSLSPSSSSSSPSESGQESEGEIVVKKRRRNDDEYDSPDKKKSKGESADYDDGKKSKKKKKKKN